VKKRIRGTLLQKKDTNNLRPAKGNCAKRALRLRKTRKNLARKLFARMRERGEGKEKDILE